MAEDQQLDQQPILTKQSTPHEVARWIEQNWNASEGPKNSLMRQIENQDVNGEDMLGYSEQHLVDIFDVFPAKAVGLHRLIHSQNAARPDFDYDVDEKAVVLDLSQAKVSCVGCSYLTPVNGECQYCFRPGKQSLNAKVDAVRKCYPVIPEYLAQEFVCQPYQGAFEEDQLFSSLMAFIAEKQPSLALVLTNSVLLQVRRRLRVVSRLPVSTGSHTRKFDQEAFRKKLIALYCTKPAYVDKYGTVPKCFVSGQVDDPTVESGRVQAAHILGKEYRHIDLSTGYPTAFDFMGVENGIFLREDLHHLIDHFHATFVCHGRQIFFFIFEIAAIQGREEARGIENPLLVQSNLSHQLAPYHLKPLSHVHVDDHQPMRRVLSWHCKTAFEEARRMGYRTADMFFPPDYNEMDDWSVGSVSYQ